MNPNFRSTTLWTRLVNVRDLYTDPLDRSAAQSVLVVNWLIFFGSIGWLLILLLLRTNTIADLIVPIIGMVLGIAVYMVLRRGQLRNASRLLVILALAAASFVVIFTGGPNRVLTALFPIVLAGVLLNRGGVVMTGATLVLVVMIDTVLRIDPTGDTLLSTLTGSIGVAVIIGLATLIQAVFVGRQRLIADQALAQMDSLERMLGATEAIDVGMTRNDVLSSMIRELRRSYQFDSVQVYLADSNGQLVQLIRAGLRRTEVLDLEADEIISAGDTHPLTDAIRYREPTHVTLNDTPTRRQYFMQNIQQGIALPLVDGEHLIGVVDIQSAQPEPIDPEQIRTMTLIVGSFATLANLIHANEQLTRNLREQEAIASRVQTQLTSEQAERRGLVTNVWSDYIDERGADAVGFDVIDKRLTPAADIPAEMREALASKGEYVAVTDTEKVLSVPILLRGETLGAMSFALPLAHALTARQIDLAKTIALRLGTALENTRLLEQTRLRAARERKATEISTLLFGASDVDALLRLAADNFNDTLGAIQTRIFIEPGMLLDNDADTPQNNGVFTNGHTPNGDHA